MVLLPAAALTGSATVFALAASPPKADGFEIWPPYFKWSHNGLFDSLDHAGIRRGYQVYKQVCAACHSIEMLRYRHLVDVCMTKEEAMAEAEEHQYEDGPDTSTGLMYKRPGNLENFPPDPYANKVLAELANNGAVPPDMSLICLARERGEDYIFSLLTSYMEPPAGVTLEDGQAFNPYFRDGNKIAMAQQLFPGSVVYDDGTPASVSQMAKDVCTFLRWSAEPYHDERKHIGIKFLMLLPWLVLAGWYWKRTAWSSLKTMQISYKPRRTARNVAYRASSSSPTSSRTS